MRFPAVDEWEECLVVTYYMKRPSLMYRNVRINNKILHNNIVYTYYYLSRSTVAAVHTTAKMHNIIDYKY